MNLFVEQRRIKLKLLSKRRNIVWKAHYSRVDGDAGLFYQREGRWGQIASRGSGLDSM